MPTPRPRTTRLPKEQRRRQLLQVALTVFSERGYHGASMEEIADAAGVGRIVIDMMVKSGHYSRGYAAALTAAVAAAAA